MSTATTALPTLSVGRRPVDQWIVPVRGETLEFRTHDVGLPAEVKLVPFYEQMGRRYVVYWDLSRP